MLGGNRFRQSFWGNAAEFDTGPLVDQWHHLTVTYNGVDRQAYLDGQSLKSPTLRGANATPDVTQGDLWIGGGPWAANDRFEGRIDEIRIYRKVLNGDAIKQLVNRPTLIARSPTPSDGAVVEPVGQLGWESDGGQCQYDVYLGEDSGQVSRASPSHTHGVYLGRTNQPHIMPTISPITEATYFWRVDTVSGATVVRGHLWSFGTARSLIIDDFESYTDTSPNRIYQTWTDGLGFTDPAPGAPGNGSGAVVGYDTMPYMETHTVYSGLQSMPLRYDNTAAPFYSEISRSFIPSQDWTEGGFKALCLHFYGMAANHVASGDKLFVTVIDGSGRSVTVSYTGSATHLNDARWHQWRISLASLWTADLSDIAEFHLSIGDKNNVVSGGNGLVFIDDICLSTKL